MGMVGCFVYGSFYDVLRAVRCMFACMGYLVALV